MEKRMVGFPLDRLARVYHLAGLFWAGIPEALIVNLALRGVVELDFQGKTKVLIRQALVFFSPLKFQLIIWQ